MNREIGWDINSNLLANAVNKLEKAIKIAGKKSSSTTTTTTTLAP